MASERQAPDAQLSCVNLVTCDVTEHDADPDSDNTCIAATGESVSTEYGVDFPTPTGNPTVGADLQEFRAGVEQWSPTQSGTPEARIELWENGSLVRLGPYFDVDTYAVLSFLWNANELSTPDGSLVQCKVTGKKSGGGPPARNAVNIGQIEWNVEYTAGGTLYYQGVGGHSMSIVGGLKKKTILPRMGGYSMSIAGGVKKKIILPRMGGYSMSIVGTLSIRKKFTKAVGGYVMNIVGTLATITRYTEPVGGHSMSITGSLKKKTSKGVGGHSLLIAGGVKKKTSKTVGGHAMSIIGSVGTSFRVKQATGGGTVSPIGTLLTQFIAGVVEEAALVRDVVRDIVSGIVKTLLK